ncbi:MAG: D-2-hydroxyacid dehydrogenase [Verrucomicrobia bacterium]|nr:D-2-hydroxyacid dehydrogenase [Verrucomicrobiota bacterium]
MHIVVLDGFTLNPGDLSWDALRALGACEIHDRSAPAEVVPRATNADIALTNKTVVSRAQLEQLPRLKYIGVLATGYNIVDVAAARERNIPVANVPTYGTRSVAQMTFALLLELTQHVGHHAQTVREGRWARSPDFCYWDYPLIELDGLTLGIVGFGRIGRAVADLAVAFGMNVLAHNRTTARAPLTHGRFVDLKTLLAESDVVSLHCPLTPDTKHLLNAERLAWLKPGAFLINTSRGPLVDESALASALNSGRLAGAALDVLAVEPPPLEHPLFAAKNCLVTPHIAWATRAARARLMQTAVANVAAFLRGEPRNVVN